MPNAPLRTVATLALIFLFSLAALGQRRPPRQMPDGAQSQASTAAPAGPIALKGGKLLTITHGTIENGVVVIENGKITAVGPAASTKIPANAHVIDVTGMTVYPGLIDSDSHLGLTEISADPMTNDMLEPSDEINPQLHVWDAFHAESELIPTARINGITNAVVSPAEGDTLPGQDSFIQLAGASAQEMLLDRDIALPLNFLAQDRRTGGRGEGISGRFPSTRMGMASQLRQTFMDAQDYAQKMSAPASSQGGRAGQPPKRDLKMEALQPYLQGKKPIVLAAEQPNDLQTAVGIANEFHLKFVLSHVNHAQPLLDYIASLHVPVIVGPIYEQPNEDERYDAVLRLPGELAKRGVKIAFASYGDTHGVRNLPYQAGWAVAFGLPYDEALKAITLNPAEIWGVADQLGSLDVGKMGNVVVATGDPLDMKSDVKHVFIGGKEIPIMDRQIELRNEYEGQHN
ncbi:MAG TPA: amidohydrolase family protein [Terriglobales bacterium]|nr:amidohydrolase family protein [Terriglobales bacterium]